MATSYVLEVAQGNGVYSVLATLQTTVSTYTHLGLVQNVTYNYRIKNVVNCLSSAYQNFDEVIISTQTTNKFVKQLEYFLDTDPGFGNGTILNTNQARLSLKEFTIPLSNITEGVHTLHLRAKDNDNNWSTVITRTFLKPSTGGTLEIDKVEYFIDTDPEFGQAINIPLSNVTDLTKPDIEFVANLQNITSGIHVLNIRARDSYGRWSNVHNQTFARFVGTGTSNQKVIDKLEYFIDTEPGVGNGIDIPVSRQIRITSQLFTVDLSNISNGLHILHVRGRDNLGKWSSVYHQAFMRLEGIGGSTPSVSKVEYFLDTDPGFDNGTDVPITAIRSLDKTFTVDLSNASNGIHALHIRARDNNGQWSNIFIQAFIKLTGTGGEAVITRLEYFFDTDPGLGQATAINVGQSRSIDVSQTINLSALANGDHVLYIRSKDNYGRWSSFFYNKFAIGSIVPIELMSFDVKLYEGNGLLTWQTASEKNTSRFDIEKSFDGQKFEKIDEVKAKGNSNQPLSYQFSDNKLIVKKAHYYRLKMVDLDSSFTYSEIKSLYLDKVQNFKALIYPNPNTGLFDLVLNGDLETDSPLSILVTDISGKQIFQTERKDFRIYEPITFNLDNLNVGLYYITVKNGSNLFSQKIVIQK